MSGINTRAILDDTRAAYGRRADGDVKGPFEGNPGASAQPIVDLGRKPVVVKTLTDFSQCSNASVKLTHGHVFEVRILKMPGLEHEVKAKGVKALGSTILSDRLPRSVEDQMFEVHKFQISGRHGVGNVSVTCVREGRKGNRHSFILQQKQG